MKMIIRQVLHLKKLPERNTRQLSKYVPNLPPS